MAKNYIGPTVLNIANSKMHYVFVQAVMLGTLCYALVCLAVWMTNIFCTNPNRITTISLPINAFIATGFEHSAANMYFMPMAIFVKIPGKWFNKGQ